MLKKTDLESAEFLSRVQQKEEEAVSQLIQHYHMRFKALLRTMVGDACCEDVLQEAWLAVFRHIAQFKRQSQLSTWLYRIMINQAKMQLRKSEHSEFSLDEDFEQRLFKKDGHWQQAPSAWHLASPEELLQNQQLCKKIASTINELPYMQHAVIVMYDIEGIKMQEICNILQLNASNGRVLLHRARNAVYHQIEDEQKC